MPTSIATHRRRAMSNCEQGINPLHPPATLHDPVHCARGYRAESDKRLRFDGGAAGCSLLSFAATP